MTKPKTITVQAYELVCQECGKTFYSENPRTKKCQECKSAVIHNRCKKYYEEVLKQKRAEANARRKAEGIKIKCRVCGKIFKADDGRHTTCPACKEAKEQAKLKSQPKKVTITKEIS